MSEPRRYFSLAGPYTALAGLLVCAVVVFTVLLGEWFPDTPLLVGSLALLVALPLAEHFLAGQKRLGEAARAALKRHYWPGNVRELKNIIQRALLLAAGDTIAPADLGFAAAPASSIPPAPSADSEPDRDAIEQALARAGGTIAQAAAELGLSRQALYRRMERLGISRPAG